MVISKATGTRGIHHLQWLFCDFVRLVSPFASQISYTPTTIYIIKRYINRREHTLVRLTFPIFSSHVVSTCKHRLHDIKPYIYKIDDAICILTTRRDCCFLEYRTLTTATGHDQFLVLFRCCCFFFLVVIKRQTRLVGPPLILNCN